MRVVRKVSIYSRTGCHLCEVAHQTLRELQSAKEATAFDIELILIDTNPELIRLYGEQVPVITIDGKVHDYFRIDPVRFLKAIR